MKKSQSLLIQFVLFFIIGFSLFLLIGNFFKYQSELFRTDIIDLSLKLTNSYFSSFAINSIDSCKQCDYVENSIKLEPTTAGYFFETTFSSEGLDVSTAPTHNSFVSSVHNLNESHNMNGKSSSAETITLTCSRTKNELERVLADFKQLGFSCSKYEVFKAIYKGFLIRWLLTLIIRYLPL